MRRTATKREPEARPLRPPAASPGLAFGAGPGRVRSRAPTLMPSFPRVVRLRQEFTPTPPVDIAAAVAREFASLRPQLRPGARIAVGVGSRGITHLRTIVRAVLHELRAAGTAPFIIPAMGSHGGATPEGQQAVLASYDITEATMGVPIQASLEVRPVGTTADGATVFCSEAALAADGIVLINRIKPHTDFRGKIGSGLLKMSVVGLGKRTGAAAMHRLASQVGHERAIRTMAGVLLRTTPILGGIAILENQQHETARIVAVPAGAMETAEEALVTEARGLMPLLPFDEIDLLIVDRIGKNISGAGMDPNVTNRWVQGYASTLRREEGTAPFIRRVFVRGLTPETHGNGIGIGLADVTTTRLVRALDLRAMGINALTSLTPNTAKIPIAFDTDREALALALESAGLDDPAAARIVRIADTLSVAEMDVSEPLWQAVRGRPQLVALGEPRALAFDAAGNLA